MNLFFEFLDSILKMEILKKIPFLKNLIFKYWKRKNPISIKDLHFQTKYSSSYALISEKNSNQFKKIINRLNCYFGSGKIGPNKVWEYPWVLSNLKLRKGMKLLDVGCGTSPLQYLLADLGIKVYGIDTHQDVRWHGIDRNLANFFGCDIKYRVESGDSISYNDNAFDRVCCVSVIEHVRVEEVADTLNTPFQEEDLIMQKEMMREMIRVLKPGGICVVTVDFNIPRDNVILESNTNVKNLINIEGTDVIGKKIEISFYGEEDFNYIDLIHNSDIDISTYKDKLQLSLGFTLKKNTLKE